MSGKVMPALPQLGEQIHTACGTRSTFESDTAYMAFRGKWVFFCLPACKKDLERDPEQSCLHWQLDQYPKE